MESIAKPPAAGPRALVVRLGVVVVAVAVGLALQSALSERLARIASRADTDVLAARRELAILMRAVLVPVLALTTAIGVAIVHTARRALRESCFPPSGTRVFRREGERVTGPPALRRARIGLGLGAALIFCSLAAGGLVWWMTRVLSFCRA